MILCWNGSRLSLVEWPLRGGGKSKLESKQARKQDRKTEILGTTV